MMENNMCTNDVTIRVRGLKKDFNDVSVLKGIDIDIHKGDVVCVIGASGSGKSTFLRCLNLLEQPTGGSIYFEGADLTDEKVDLNLHRQKMGMVFQQFNLFPHMSILENLTCAPVLLKKATPEQAKAKAMELLARLFDHFVKFPEQMPEIYYRNTSTDEDLNRGSKLFHTLAVFHRRNGLGFSEDLGKIAQGGKTQQLRNL